MIKSQKAKPKSSPNITMEEWITATFPTLPDKPANAITVEELAKKTGLSKSHTCNVLNQLTKDGKVKKGKCVINGKSATYYIPLEI